MKQLFIRINDQWQNKRGLFSNIIHLFIYQGANYVIPLIALPYLIRVLEPQKFGIMIFAQAFIQYFVVFTDYGFNLSATQQISINRKDKTKLNEIFSSVIVTKVLLMIIAAVVCLIFVTSFERLAINRSIYFYTFLIVVGNVIFPVWLFQGLEKMKYIAVLIIIPKTIFTILLFFTVRSPLDLSKAVIIQNSSGIISGIVALFIIYKKLLIRFVFPTKRSILDALREGWDIFISGVAVNLYTSTNIVILGFLSNDITVGLYGAAEKIIRIILALFSPFNNALFPYFSSLVTESRELALHFISKVIKLLGMAALFVSVSVFLLADIIGKYILGSEYGNSIDIIRILSPLPILMFISNSCGVQIMLNFGLKKVFRKILILASFLSFSLIFPFTLWINMYGTALTWIIVEVFVSSTMIYELNRNQINLFGFKKLFNFK